MWARLAARRFSTPVPKKTPGFFKQLMRNKDVTNVLIALSLCAFTGSVYYSTMKKISNTDEFAQLEAEGLINVAPEGTGYTVPNPPKQRPRSSHEALAAAKKN